MQWCCNQGPLTELEETQPLTRVSRVLRSVGFFPATTCVMPFFSPSVCSHPFSTSNPQSCDLSLLCRSKHYTRDALGNWCTKKGNTFTVSAAVNRAGGRWTGHEASLTPETQVLLSRMMPYMSNCRKGKPTSLLWWLPKGQQKDSEKVCGHRPSRHLAPKCPSRLQSCRFYPQQAYQDSSRPYERRREKECKGKKKGVGGRMQDRTQFKKDGERGRERDQQARENTPDHLIKQSRLVPAPRWALTSIYLLLLCQKVGA